VTHFEKQVKYFELHFLENLASEMKHFEKHGKTVENIFCVCNIEKG